MIVKPVIGDWEIPNISSIKTIEQRWFAELPIPGRTGSLFQDLNTKPADILITGSLYGDEARNSFIEDIREKFNNGEPVTFVADIVTATSIQYVVISRMYFEENAQYPDQTDYRIIIKESPPPPPESDPLGSIDTGLLDGAGGFLDSVTGALDAIDDIGSIPELSDPTPPLQDALTGISSTVAGLGDAASALNNLFGEGD